MAKDQEKTPAENVDFEVDELTEELEEVSGGAVTMNCGGCTGCNNCDSGDPPPGGIARA